MTKVMGACTKYGMKAVACPIADSSMGSAGSKEENVESAGLKGKKEEGGSERMGCRRKEKQMTE